MAEVLTTDAVDRYHLTSDHWGLELVSRAVKPTRSAPGAGRRAPNTFV